MQLIVSQTRKTLNSPPNGTRKIYVLPRSMLSLKESREVPWSPRSGEKRVVTKLFRSHPSNQPSKGRVVPNLLLDRPPLPKKTKVRPPRPTTNLLGNLKKLETARSLELLEQVGFTQKILERCSSARSMFKSTTSEAASENGMHSHRSIHNVPMKPASLTKLEV
jgi:hypothetical protein